MRFKDLLSAFLCCLSLLLCAQEQMIDTVKIFDNQLGRSGETQLVQQISSEDLTKNSGNLSELLRFQSAVYIKENGRGMTSSPSFRGTTAQQTAFVWNGININSMFLGQGDINNVGLLGYDNIGVKSGGGSVVYGSGAIGGSIHLNNELRYSRGWENRCLLEAGSFATYAAMMKTSFSNEKFSFSASEIYNRSENNYEVPERHYISRSGQYHNTTVNIGTAYQIGRQNEIVWHSQRYNGLQHYPTTSESATKTMYETDNFRSLLGWNLRTSKLRNQLSAALITEEFRYFPDASKPAASGAQGNTYLFKNDFDFAFDRIFSFNILSEWKQEKAEGFGSGIRNPRRYALSAAALLRTQLSDKFFVEGGLRKNKIEGISSPMQYSLGANYRPAAFYTLRVSASKNFRAPTFNDLYWSPGGNRGLKPETSYQAELGNELRFGNVSLKAVPYFIYVENLIQWVPSGLGYWSPVNVYRMRSFGVESQLSYKKAFGENLLGFFGGYTFTNSENLETRKKMTYVPVHKFFGTAQLTRGSFSLYIQGMFNGLTYTTTDESYEGALRPYFVLNSGVNFSILKYFTLGVKASNLTGQVYETVSYYAMPKRSFSGTFSINL